MKRQIFSSNGSSVELNNCLFEATADLRDKQGQHNAIIEQSLSAGLFVVVEVSEWRCRSTDAVAGELRSFVQSFQTRLEADQYVEKTYEASGAMGWPDDVRLEVLPMLPTHLATTLPYPDDDVIF